jgi:hypothetical protein
MALLLFVGPTQGQVDPDVQAAREELAPYMNSIPPSKDYFCVGTGPEDRVRHPDRAPHTVLAEQDGVVLFSGTAPQQGLNFTLRAGSLVYRNQMSTLGSVEPSPQVGTAGTLLQRPWGATATYTDEPMDTIQPWGEARWHPGEDISWQGYRHTLNWLGGIPLWRYVTNPATCDSFAGGVYDYLCPDTAPAGQIYRPCVEAHANTEPWGLRSSINLQLARGTYQLSKVRADFWGDATDECPESFRESWFQGRARLPAFNVQLPSGSTNLPDSSSPTQNTAGWTNDHVRIAERYFPNFLNIYPFRQLELDGGRLVIDFERSATWPRDSAGEESGSVLAESVRDEYGNVVSFDRVPAYGWETDFKLPSRPDGNLDSADPHFGTGADGLYSSYEPNPNAWRLPHKRLRTVRLYSADQAPPIADGSDGPPPGEADWTIAFVFEHPESDRIGAHDTPVPEGSFDEYVQEWKSIYSHLPQVDWEFGRLPELNDETTLLTVQVYEGDVAINGAPFQDDYSVWGTTVGAESAATKKRVNAGIEYPGDYNGDGCPGICGIDDDGDGLIDECCAVGTDPGESCTVIPPCEEDGTCTAPDGKCCCNDDDEDGVVEPISAVAIVQGVSRAALDGWRTASDPYGNQYAEMEEGLYCPGMCGIDDDADGQTDETSDGETYPDDQWKDPFFVYDDDEDGVYDEDSAEDPLLVHLRMIEDPECASGRYPFVPRSKTTDVSPTEVYAQMPGREANTQWDHDCRPVLEAADDPWVYQVQYVYSRSNPYWLLSARKGGPDGTSVPDPESQDYGRVEYLKKPRYYYFPPFHRDLNADGQNSLLHCDQAACVDPSTGGIFESDLAACGVDEFKDMVVDSEGDGDGLPNVHPDCVPDPDFRGPTSFNHGGDTVTAEQVGPGDIHLIKRIVRTRPDPDRRNEIIEQVWLYRYNDFGFLKAVFDPVSVQSLIDAVATDPDVPDDDKIKAPDDILKYADTYEVNGRPLIMYASQWYTYYNPITPITYDEDGNLVGIPPCYDEAPYRDLGTLCKFDGGETDLEAFGVYGPLSRHPENVCDGYPLWADGYGKEMHTDPDCSEFMRQDCGWCKFRRLCADLEGNEAVPCQDRELCTCVGSAAADEDQLVQLGSGSTWSRRPGCGAATGRCTRTASTTWGRLRASTPAHTSPRTPTPTTSPLWTSSSSRRIASLTTAARNATGPARTSSISMRTISGSCSMRPRPGRSRMEGRIRVAITWPRAITCTCRQR